MRTTSLKQHNARLARHEATIHLFAIGQAVRLKGGFGRFPRTRPEIYRVTATLPPKEDSPQYRIRSSGELHERMATQDSLQPVEISPGDGTTLIERTFEHGERPETQQSRDQETEAGKGPAQA